MEARITKGMLLPSHRFHQRFLLVHPRTFRENSQVEAATAEEEEAEAEPEKVPSPVKVAEEVEEEEEPEADSPDREILLPGRRFR